MLPPYMFNVFCLHRAKDSRENVFPVKHVLQVHKATTALSIFPYCSNYITGQY